MFAIPLNETSYGYGQIVTTYKDCFLIFDFVTDDHPAIDDIINKPILLLAFSVDVKITHSEWLRNGNAPVFNNINFPIYKIQTPMAG
ncbi:hypothetical protein HQN90_15775 [Paenibacillus alba]|uniref:Imm26 family immunity protein n=1 Tax=Paenibacillus alba TaxID=1197127 RepID=UPI001564AD15|nr:hypothetical protein [Paenibacillus alba]